MKAQQFRPRAAWLTVLLLALLLLSVAWLVQRAEWVDGMPSLALVVVVGLSGWLLLDGLGWSGWKVHVAGVAIGALVVWVLSLGLPGGSITSEFSYWASGLTNGEERGGEVIFAVFFLALFWLLSFEGAWMTLRHGQPWPVIVIGGVVLAISMVFLPASFRIHVIPFIVGALFLLLHLSVLHRLQDWASRMLRHSERTLLSHYGLAFGIAIVAAALVWLLPQMQAAPLKPAARLVQGPVERVERGFQRVFAGLPSRFRSAVLLWDDSTRFAGAQDLTDTLLFTVEGESPQYWRARVYDSYTTTGWRSTFSDFVPWEARDSLGGLQNRINVAHTFRVNAATDTLFFGGEPLQFTLPAQALARSEAAIDVLQMRLSEDVLSYFKTRVNLKYAALSSVPFVSEQALAAAGTDYPEWVVDNYLSLPTALPRRVGNLARAVIQGARTPHDAAIAVRNFLLRYPYNLNIAAPPEGRDGVDYFLFDSQEGYCDYYASSMVVMLRSIGVPARYVVGYSPGSWNSTEKVFEVRELNYHSWAEVYFPGYGWVPFEPTPPDAIEFRDSVALYSPGQEPGEIPEELLPEDPDLTELADLIEPPGTVGGSLPSTGSILVWVVLGLVGILVIALIAGWYRWWGRLGLLQAPRSTYHKMARLASLLGMGPSSSDTPLEFARNLALRLEPQGNDVMKVARAYVLFVYGGQQSARLADLGASNQAWRRLRWVMLRRFLRGWMGLRKPKTVTDST